MTSQSRAQRLTDSIVSTRPEAVLRHQEVAGDPQDRKRNAELSVRDTVMV